MKKKILLLIGAALIFTIGIGSQTTAQPSDQAKPPKADAAAIARGAKAWTDQCGRCHNLRSPSELNAELWDVSVQHMRVRANLPGSVADDIKAFLMSSATTKGVQASTSMEDESAVGLSYAYLNPGDPVHGEELYSQTCIACHGPDGKGAIAGIPDLTLTNGRLSKSNDVLMANVINGYQSEGSLMAMPPKGGNPELSEQDIADVLAYLREEYGIPPTSE